MDYNVYCRGRMTQADANRFGRALVEENIELQFTNAPRPDRPNLIQDEFEDAGLTPRYVSTPHVFHYGCNDTINGGTGVATHIKVRVIGQGEEAADSCSLLRTEGTLARGQYYSLVYKPCTDYIASGETDHITSLAQTLTRRDVVGNIAFPTGASVCVLPTTDIQCSPCSTSDTLVVRTFINNGRVADAPCAGLPVL